MPSLMLPDRAMLFVSGDDAQHFLQTIITTDVDALPDTEVRPGALLSPQGKILFDFLLSRAGAEAFRIDCRADIAADLGRRLTLYKLRAKVAISLQDQPDASVSWNDSSDAPHRQADTVSGNAQILRDARFPPPASAWRSYGRSPAAGATPSAWDALRIENGVAESGRDYALGEAFPHDVLLDQNGGVGLRKGCFVGQEVVSRMQHRGTARRRVLIAQGAGALPAPMTPITAGGRELGHLGTAIGTRALALLRIDRAAEAMAAGTPILAGEVALLLSLPPNVSFGFPAPSAQAADAD